MTSTSPATPPVCANGPHPLPTDGPWQNNILYNIDGRLVCHGCWTVGGILPGDGEEGQ